MAALMALALDEAHPAMLPVSKKVVPIDRWDRVFNAEQKEQYVENGLTIPAAAAPATAPPLTPAEDEILSRLVKQFEDAADSTTEYRRRAEHWRDYYDGDQWTDTEKTALELRNQPCITDNRIGDKVQYLMGLERRTRTDPKAYPRTPADEESAEAATDALRYIFECNDFEQSRSIVFENMMVEGTGALEVVRVGDKDKIRKIRWDRFYYDPHSMELDFSDSLYFGVITWFDDPRLLRKYPDHGARRSRARSATRTGPRATRRSKISPRCVSSTTNAVACRSSSITGGAASGSAPCS